MAAEQNEPLVLAVDVPANAEPGSLFHVALENRYFEVTVPEGVAPGDTINIIVPPSPATTAEVAGVKSAAAFDSIQAISDAALQQAKILDEKFHVVERVKNLDEQYKVTERVTALAAQAQTRAQELDAKYEITNRLGAVIKPGVERAKALDEQMQVTRRAIVVGEAIIAYAREIDAKFAISATTARVVVAGANAIVAGYKAALALEDKHHIVARAAAVTGAVIARAAELDARFEVTATATKVVANAQTVFTKATSGTAAPAAAADAPPSVACH